MDEPAHPTGFPPGHFYSPIPCFGNLARRRRDLWPRQAPSWPGVDLRLADQRDLLAALGGDRHAFPYPPAGAPRPDLLFTLDNGFFTGLDARCYFHLLRRLRPRRVVEIGSGFSTRLCLDAAATLAEPPDLVAIDPFPDPELARIVRGRGGRLLPVPAEEAGFGPFRDLGPGDVLFIDSSHVARIGSDVVFLLLDVVPRLAPGCWIHVHDIFLPWDYPEDWVLGEGRAWNEQYLLHALLVFSSILRVRLACAAAHAVLADAVLAAFGEAISGGSIWLERVGPTARFPA